MLTMCIPGAQRSKEDVQSAGTGVMDGINHHVRAEN